MSEIPREFIDQLLNRVDIVDLIDGRLTFRKKTGVNFFACCPFHNEKSPSFSVSQQKQFYYCFGCGAHGNAIDFLMKYDRLSFPEAIEALAKQVGMEVPRQASPHFSKEKSAQQQSLYELMENVNKFFQAQLRQHHAATRVVDYLKQRGVSGEMAKEFGVGFAPTGWDNLLNQFLPQKNALLETGMLIKKDDGGMYDRFRDRIMFPIHDRRGRIVGFGGRIIDQGEPKYLNSPETPIFQKGHELYGLYQTLQANRDVARIIVVEGYMDVIALFQHNIKFAVATLGTATTASHLERLFRHTSEIIFCFDGDQAGRTAAWRALQVTLPLMHDGVQVRFLFLPDGEDPDTLVRKEGTEKFIARIQEATTIADFFFHTLAAQADTSSTDGRARFVKLATDLLKNLPESIFQKMMLDELAKRARVDISHLQQPQKATTQAQTQTTSLKAKPISPIRLALSLLVQQPALAAHVPDDLSATTLSGFELFMDVARRAKQDLQIKPAALIEFWREQPDHATLIKLLHWEHMIPEKGIEQEFIGAIKKIKKSSLDNTIEKLLSKAAQVGLSNEEKLHLTQLINANKDVKA